MIATQYAQIDELLQALGSEFWMTGGALRDKHTGKVPKDLDLLYFGLTRHEATKRFRDTVERLGHRYIPVVLNHEDEEHVASTSTRVEFLGVDTRKIVLSDGTELVVDLLWYDCASPEEVLEHFDFNCNALAVSWNGKHWSIASHHTYGAWVTDRHLIQIRGTEVSDKRTQYLIDKLQPGVVILADGVHQVMQYGDMYDYA